LTPHFAEVFHHLSDDYRKLLDEAQAVEAKSMMGEKASGSDCVILFMISKKLINSLHQ
jgi:hypothetical protein